MTNSSGERLGFDRFVKIVGREGSGKSNESVQRILKALREFREGGVPADDMTLMVVRVTG